MEQLDTRPAAPVDQEINEAGPAPPQVSEMWIGTSEDYATDRRFGDWIDATQRPREVVTAIRGVIDRTPDGLGRHWNICELRGFGGWQPAEYEGLPTVLEVARGVAIHGPAYGALAARLGADSIALRADKYPLSYLGEWASLRDFAETVARESGWTEQLARPPHSMQPYVHFDLPRLMREAKAELTVIEHERGVWVYDPRRW